MFEEIKEKIYNYTQQIKSAQAKGDIENEISLINQRKTEINILRQHILDKEALSEQELVSFVEKMQNILENYRGNELCQEIKNQGLMNRSILMKLLYSGIWTQCGF